MELMYREKQREKLLWDFFLVLSYNSHGTLMNLFFKFIFWIQDFWAHLILLESVLYLATKSFPHGTPCLFQHSHWGSSHGRGC